jgi:hypothetical protein
MKKSNEGVDLAEWLKTIDFKQIWRKFSKHRILVLSFLLSFHLHRSSHGMTHIIFMLMVWNVSIFDIPHRLILIAIDSLNSHIITCKTICNDNYSHLTTADIFHSLMLWSVRSCWMKRKSKCV